MSREVHRKMASLSIPDSDDLLNSSPNCAPKGLQIVLSAPRYSVENTCTPSVSIRLLVEGFWENSDLMVLAQSALHLSAQLTVRLSRTSAEQLTCSTHLLGFVPMHSDSQQFVRVASWFETFTAVTRVRIPSGTPVRIKELRWASPNIRRCKKPHFCVPFAPSRDRTSAKPFR